MKESWYNVEKMDNIKRWIVLPDLYKSRSACYHGTYDCVQQTRKRKTFGSPQTLETAQSRIPKTILLSKRRKKASIRKSVSRQKPRQSETTGHCAPSPCSPRSTGCVWSRLRLLRREPRAVSHIRPFYTRSRHESNMEGGLALYEPRTSRIRAPKATRLATYRKNSLHELQFCAPSR